MRRRYPARRSFDPASLARLRALTSDEALAILAVYIKRDPDYVPRKNTSSSRWHVLSSRGDFEIITTGVKWFDMHARKGGGGAIDLAMHLEALSFVDAVNHLMQRLPLRGLDHS
jgi:hypothetical protein